MIKPLSLDEGVAVNASQEGDIIAMLGKVNRDESETRSRKLNTLCSERDLKCFHHSLDDVESLCSFGLTMLVKQDGMGTSSLAEPEGLDLLVDPFQVRVGAGGRQSVNASERPEGRSMILSDSPEIFQVRQSLIGQTILQGPPGRCESSFHPAAFVGEIATPTPFLHKTSRRYDGLEVAFVESPGTVRSLDLDLITLDLRWKLDRPSLLEEEKVRES